MTIVIELEHYTYNKWVKVYKTISLPSNWSNNTRKIQETVDYIATTKDAYAWSWEERT